MAFGNVTGAASLDQSALISTFDIDMPEVRNRLLAPYGDQFVSEFHLMEDLGYTRGVAQDSVRQYEEDWISQPVYVGSGGITDAGSGVYTFVLNVNSPTNSFLATSAVSPYTAATYKTPVRINDRLWLQGDEGFVQFQVKNVAGSHPTVTVTMEISDTSKSITVGDYPAGTAIMIGDNVWAEGTGQPTGIVNKPYSDYAYLQICKENFGVTGTQMTNQAWFTMADFGGDLGRRYFIKGQFNAEYKAKKQRFLAMMFGQVTTAMMDTGVNEPYISTEGHIEYATRRGSVLPYVNGSWSPLMLDVYNKTLDSLNAPGKYMIACGSDLSNQIDNALKSYLQFTPADYIIDGMNDSLFGGDKGKAVSVGFKYIEKGGRTFAKKTFRSWSDASTLGLSGYKTPGLGWIAPLGFTKDTRVNEARPFFGMVYKELDGYSRKYELWNRRGAGGNPGQYILAEDLAYLDIRQHFGAEHFGGQLQIVTPLAA